MMETTTAANSIPRPAPQGPRLVESRRFDWHFISLCSWIILGILMDGWAHSHGRVDDSFFTPWHGLLYSGVAAALLYTLASLVVNYRRGYRRLQLLPAGYELSLVGLVLFGLAGLGDMLWHEAFGIEKDLAAIVSPTHLLLAIALGLVVTGPARSAWRRPGRSPRQAVPVVTSLAFVLIALTLLTLYAHPFTRVSADRLGAREQELGLASILLQSGILMAIVLLSLRRWQLPFGSYFAIMGLNGLLIATIYDSFNLLPPLLVAGMATDILNSLWQPGAHQGWRLRLFAFLVPSILYAGYFLTLYGLKRLQWEVHLWAGGVVLAGIVGWLLSYLLWPPPLPEEHRP